MALGSAPQDWLNSEYAFWVLVLCYLWKYFGYNVILWLAGLSAIPESYYEAARVDGANEAQCFFPHYAAAAGYNAVYHERARADQLL